LSIRISTKLAKMENLRISNIFSVEGIVAVVTGGGTGTSEAVLLASVSNPLLSCRSNQLAKKKERKTQK